MSTMWLAHSNVVIGREGIPLVGRQDVMSALDALLAIPADVSMFLLSGEAGIGKTRIVEAFIARAEAQEHRVFVGGCVKVSGDPIPYAPVAEALRQLNRLASAAGSADPDRIRVDAQHLIGPTADVQWDRAGLFERILITLTESMPDEGRLVLVLEDLHWADQGTLDLISFLSRNMPEGMALLLTMRSDEGDLSSVRDLIGVLARSHLFARSELPRFTAAEVRELATHVVGRAVSTPEIRELFARSQGNPFIAEELLTAGEGGRVPDVLQDIWLTRAKYLGRSTEEALHVLAVVGRPADFDLLAAACGMTDETLADALRNCVGSGLVLADARTGNYSLRHVLMQDAFLAGMMLPETRRLHSAVADALSTRAEITNSASRTAEWASHLYVSGRLREAFHAALAAGALAALVHAYTVAWGQYERALRLRESLGDDVPLPVDALVGAADAARWAGSLSDAVDLAAAAADLVRDPGDRAAALERLGRYLWEAGEVDQAQRAFDEATAVAASIPDLPVTARVAATRARFAVQRGNYQQAMAMAADAARLAARLGAAADEGRALTAWGSALVYIGQIEEGLRLLDRGRDLVHRFGDLDDRRRADSSLMVGLAIAGRTGAACDVALTGLQAVRRYGVAATGGGALTSNTVVLLRMAGRWAEAESVSDEAFPDVVPEGQALRIYLARAELEIRRGRVAEARRFLNEAWTDEWDHQLVGVEADLELAEADLASLRGDLDAARDRLDRAFDAADGVESVRLSIRCCTQALCVEADAAASGSGRRATPSAVSAARLAGLTARLDALDTEALEIQAYRSTAEAEAGRAHRRTAPAAWRAAVAAWEAVERPRGVAYCLFRQAEAELTARHAAAAVAPLRRAFIIAAELGAEPLTAMIEDLSRRRRIELVGEPRARMVARTATGAVLTEREIDVLRELVQGRTNRQIADALFLSHRTVGVHVSNLLAKLSVRTRGEAMAEAARLHLLDAPDGAPRVP